MKKYCDVPRRLEVMHSAKREEKPAGSRTPRRRMERTAELKPEPSSRSEIHRSPGTVPAQAFSLVVMRLPSAVHRALPTCGGR